MKQASGNPPVPVRRSFIGRLFMSPSETRLRAGWRLALQTVLLVALLIGIQLPAFAFGFTIHEPLGGFEFIVLQLVELLAITGSVLLARRLLDNRSFSSLGLRLDVSAIRDIVSGFAITFGMMGLIFVSEIALGWLQIGGFVWQSEPLPSVVGNTGLSLLICLLIGWNEELLSRGYHFQTVASGLNRTWGWLLSSVVFGALHIGNPHSTGVAALGIVLAGLFLGYAYIRTGQLWLSIGLHMGWNFFEGVVFGFPVSGTDFYNLAQVTVDGPALWTGAEFGPEAGLIVIPALILGALLVHQYTGGRQTA